MKDNVFKDSPLEALGAFQHATSAQVARPMLMSGPVVPGNGKPSSGTSPKGAYRLFGKRLGDLLFVVVSLPLTLPLILVCALALWVGGGQPFYRQKRLGRNGRTFSMLKLRTMHRNADQMLESYLAADPALRAEWDNTQKLKNDPRITRLGTFMRQTSLDELPQLWNVLIGDMSVVGPRPMMPEQLPFYKDPVPYFDMRPGITGLWQVSDRNGNSFAHRSTVDAKYHTCLSLATDLRIMVQTISVVFRRTGY